MPCFIMYAQIIGTLFDTDIQRSCLLTWTMLKRNGDISTFMKVIMALYGVFHLDLVHLILPPFCISSRLKLIHVVFFGCFSLFHPILLIFLISICVELHGRNFRSLVWLWRPFHRCFVRLRRGWDTKSDIIDVFITFFCLSYTTLTHKIRLMLDSTAVVTVDASGMRSATSLRPVVDQSLTYNDVYYYLFAIPSLFTFLVFNILLPLLLMLYPIRAFRSCLSKCHLKFIALNIFIEKVHRCYRNDLNGGRDMRSFSGLYFVLFLLLYLVKGLAMTHMHYQPFFVSGIFFSITTLTIALAKPYKKAYMTYLDTLILF